MMYVEGNNNYIEHSWIWLGDHWGCNNSCSDGNCPSAPETTGLNVKGNLNTFVGMFIEHQQHPIIINGNKNKLIWVQGEGAYKNMPTTTSYISIDDKVQDLTFVMAGIYSIAQQTIAGINFDSDGWMNDAEKLFGSDPNDMDSVPNFSLYVSIKDTDQMELLFHHLQARQHTQCRMGAQL